MKKLFAFLCIVLASFTTVAQKSLINRSSLSVADLNTEQRQRYDKLESLDLHVPGGLFLVSTDVPPNIEEGNSITLTSPLLPCGTITFAASTVEFKDRDNFSWSGRVMRDQDQDCASGDIIIQKNDGLFIGNFTIDDNSFELYDLTGGVQLLIASSMDLKGKLECSTIDGAAAKPTDVTEGPCASVVTKVLVLYTDATLAKTTDINGTAHLAIAQTNQIWANSGVGNTVSLAGLVKVNWTHYAKVKDDAEELADAASIQALRDANNAEMVIMLGPDYEDAYGYSKNIGGPYEDAYAALNVTTATNGRYTFAHELNHLFGARHDPDHDSDPGTSHGKWFYSGALSIFHIRFTLMAVLTGNNKTRIMHVSNPDINYAGYPTGNWNKNNALKVNQAKYTVANFKDDPSLGFYTQMNMANPAYCETDGTATAIPQCGIPPYTYQWYTTWPIGSSGWTALGNGQTTPTHIPLSSYGLYSKAYRVIVTDATGNTAIYTKYAHSYCEEQQPYEPVNPYVAGTGSNSNSPNENGNAVSGVAMKEEQVTVYPNPNNGAFTIELSGFVKEQIDIMLVDLSGKPVATLYSGMVNGNEIIPVDIRNKAAKGIYFMKVKGKSSNFTRKFILN